MEHYKELISNVLGSLDIQAECVDVGHNKNIVFFDLRLFGNAKISKIESFNREIGLGLRSFSIPNISVIPEKGIVRIKIATGPAPLINFNELYNYQQKPKGVMQFLLGESADMGPIWVDMATNPHMLVAGTTGSGKSSLLHVMIANAIKGDDIDLFLSDPKNGVEFGHYSNVARRIATSYKETLEIVNHLHVQMEKRYLQLRSNNLRSIEQSPGIFNKQLLIIDEVSDLMIYDRDKKNPNRGSFENKLIALAQKSRAAGIYLVVATQRPSVEVITGQIKANFPARIACKVASAVDSRVILDDIGAENLIGKGDAIINSAQYGMVRFQSAFFDFSKIN
jgi:S-DNA-T family DNA segregation ATPase FtsK/SpoIIIE